MSGTYGISATAKINLYLRVCGTLPNGYHRLNTLMHEISLSDEVQVTVDDDREHEIVAVCRGGKPIPNNKNLCYKAAVRFFSALKKSKGVKKLPYVEITIDKNIPSEAGIGGGSSDAAAVILSLAEHYGNPFTIEELNEIAAHTGADTPFFLYGGACVCEGFGEEITSIEPLTGLSLLLIKPKDGVSTPWCFSKYDDDVDGRPTFDEKSYELFKKALYEADKPLEVIKNIKELLVNDLSKYAEEKLPQIKEAREKLDELGAEFASMSGSGSCVFGIFEDEAKRDLAYDKISSDSDFMNKGFTLFKCETL